MLKLDIHDNNALVLFWGDSVKYPYNGAFSNFFYLKHTDEAGTNWSCSEAQFMYYKALNAGDTEAASVIVSSSENIAPKDAKSIGRKITNYDDDKWAQSRYAAMYDVCYWKYQSNIGFFTNVFALIPNDKNVIFVEASPYDKIWGVGQTAETIRTLLGGGDTIGVTMFLWDIQHKRDYNLLGKVWTQLYQLHKMRLQRELAVSEVK